LKFFGFRTIIRRLARRALNAGDGCGSMASDKWSAPTRAGTGDRPGWSTAIRRILAGATAVAVLASCTAVDKFSQHSVEYNLQAETIKNQNLLLNIVRAAYRKPMQFTDLSTITGQVSLSGTVGLSLPFGGPPDSFNRVTLVSPSMTTTDSPSFTVSVLNTKEFYQGILTPLPMQTISFYIQLGIPMPVLMTLAIADITYGPPDSLTRVHNRPADYDRFQTLLQALLDLGLNVEQVEDTEIIGTPLDEQGLPRAADAAALDAKGIKIVRHSLATDGGGLPPDQVARFRRAGYYYQLEKTDLITRFCFDRRLTRNGVTLTPGMPIADTGEHLEASAICGAAKAAAAKSPTEQQRAAGIHNLQTATSAAAQGPAAPANVFSFSTRSTEAIIYFLGELARHDLGLVEPRFTPTVLGNLGPNVLFHISAGRGGKNAIDVGYDGRTYHIDVDPTGHDRSSQVMELVTEFLAQNNSAKDLPAPSVIPIAR
jgi:hypothetical protein